MGRAPVVKNAIVEYFDKHPNAKIADVIAGCAKQGIRASQGYVANLQTEHRRKNVQRGKPAQRNHLAGRKRIAKLTAPRKPQRAPARGKLSDIAAARVTVAARLHSREIDTARVSELVAATMLLRESRSTEAAHRALDLVVALRGS